MEIGRAEPDMVPMPVAAVFQLLAARVLDCDTQEKREELAKWLQRLASSYEPVAIVSAPDIGARIDI